MQHFRQLKTSFLFVCFVWKSVRFFSIRFFDRLMQGITLIGTCYNINCSTEANWKSHLHLCVCVCFAGAGHRCRKRVPGLVAFSWKWLDWPVKYWFWETFVGQTIRLEQSQDRLKNTYDCLFNVCYSTQFQKYLLCWLNWRCWYTIRR